MKWPPNDSIEMVDPDKKPPAPSTEFVDPKAIGARTFADKKSKPPSVPMTQAQSTLLKSTPGPSLGRMSSDGVKTAAPIDQADDLCSGRSRTEGRFACFNNAKKKAKQANQSSDAEETGLKPGQRLEDDNGCSFQLKEASYTPKGRLLSVVTDWGIETRRIMFCSSKSCNKSVTFPLYEPRRPEDSRVQYFGHDRECAETAEKEFALKSVRPAGMQPDSFRAASARPVWVMCQSCPIHHLSQDYTSEGGCRKTKLKQAEMVTRLKKFISCADWTSQSPSNPTMVMHSCTAEECNEVRNEQTVKGGALILARWLPYFACSDKCYQKQAFVPSTIGEDSIAMWCPSNPRTTHSGGHIVYYRNIISSDGICHVCTRR